MDVPDTHLFVDDIVWLVDREITFGCDADGLYFCPDADISRGQMASFIDRAFDLADTATDFFSDDSGSVHEAAINRVAAAGITFGCDSGDPALYCPVESVTRQQMASFLVRAAPSLALTGVDFFVDDDGNPHEANINRLAAGGVTLGCDVADPSLYCPFADVTRGQMAAFIHRLFDVLGL